MKSQHLYQEQQSGTRSSHLVIFLRYKLQVSHTSTKRIQPIFYRRTWNWLLRGFTIEKTATRPTTVVKNILAES